MKFSVAAIFTAAVASAASVPSTVFKVTDFSAGCIPHSTQCLYSFDVIQPGTMETTPVHCKALVPANTDGTLPDIAKWSGKCEQSSRTFWVHRGEKGLKFSVSQPVTPSSNQTGTHFIPNAQLKMSNQPNAVVQSYKGPVNFPLVYSV